MNNSKFQKIIFGIIAVLLTIVIFVIHEIFLYVVLIEGIFAIIVIKLIMFRLDKKKKYKHQWR